MRIRAGSGRRISSLTAPICRRRSGQWCSWRKLGGDYPLWLAHSLGCRSIPNAIAVKPVDGPDVRIIPWFNIFFFGFLIVGIAFLRAMWMQFRERTVDPMLDSAEHRFDEASAEIAEQKGRVTRWFGTWKKEVLGGAAPARSRPPRYFRSEELGPYSP